MRTLATAVARLAYLDRAAPVDPRRNTNRTTHHHEQATADDGREALMANANAATKKSTQE